MTRLLVVLVALAAGCASSAGAPSPTGTTEPELVTPATVAPPVPYVPRRAVGVINPTGRLTG